MGYHLGDVSELCVAAAMIPMVMRVQDILDRRICNAFDVGHDLVIVLLKLVIDHDDTVVGDTYADVASRPGDHIQAVYYFSDRKRFGLSLSKRRQRGGTYTHRRSQSHD